MKINSLDIGDAVQLLRSGEIVSLPTETVYGLAGAINQPEAIAKIFKIKERPFFDPLIVHVSSVAQAKMQVSQWPKSADILASAFWPGPLTLVLPKAKHISDLITSGLNTVGIRWPKHSLTEAVIHELAIPVAAPSANKFGKTSPTEAKHVVQEFSGQVPVLDGGSCSVGLESTIIQIDDSSTKPILKILRPGVISAKSIENEFKSKKVNFSWQQAGEEIMAPGQIKHHYMPSVPLVLIEQDIESSKVKEYLTYEVQKKLHKKILYPASLDLSEDPSIAARQLYSQLRKTAEQKNVDLIYFIKKPIHNNDLWLAFFDRLQKAASLRI